MNIFCLFGHQKHYKSVIRKVSPNYGLPIAETFIWEARWICGRDGCRGFGATERNGGHWKVENNKVVPDRQKWVDGERW